MGFSGSRHGLLRFADHFDAGTGIQFQSKMLLRVVFTVLTVMKSVSAIWCWSCLRESSATAQIPVPQGECSCRFDFSIEFGRAWFASSRMVDSDLEGGQQGAFIEQLNNMSRWVLPAWPVRYNAVRMGCEKMKGKLVMLLDVPGDVIPSVSLSRLISSKTNRVQVVFSLSCCIASSLSYAMPLTQNHCCRGGEMFSASPARLPRSSIFILLMRFWIC